MAALVAPPAAMQLSSQTTAESAGRPGTGASAARQATAPRTVLPANGVPPVFAATLESARLMASLVGAISTQQRATCYVSNMGIKISTEDNRVVQAHAYLQKSIFSDFQLQRDLTFGLNIEVFLTCLKIFGAPNKEGPPVSLSLVFEDEDEALLVVLHEGGLDGQVKTSCRMRTYNPATPVNFNFRDSPIANKVIIRSSWLKEAFDEMEASCEIVNILVTPSAPYFRISTVGQTGYSEMDYPNNSDIIETFQCEDMTLQSFRQTSLSQALKALAISEKTSLRMNRRGFLSLQFLVRSDANDLFVEFFVAPIDTDAMDDTPS